MLARVRSAAVFGIDAYLVDVETDIANGMPTFATVGLPQGAVKEGRERVYAALANTGYTFPLKRITGKGTACNPILPPSPCRFPCPV